MYECTIFLYLLEILTNQFIHELPMREELNSASATALQMNKIPFSAECPWRNATAIGKSMTWAWNDDMLKNDQAFTRVSKI